MTIEEFKLIIAGLAIVGLTVILVVIYDAIIGRDIRIRNSYYQEINRVFCFSVNIGYRRHTTSRNTAVSEIRNLQKMNYIIEPIRVQQKFSEIKNKYCEKYPKKKDLFETMNFEGNSERYLITLNTKSRWCTHSFKYSEINEFNTKTERKLMTPKLREYIKNRDNYTCQRCRRDLSENRPYESHIDHITPVSLGGKTTPENLQLLCYLCNMEKGVK